MIVAPGPIFSSWSPLVGDEIFTDCLSLSTFFTSPDSSLPALAVVPVWLDALWLVDDWPDGLVVVDDWPDELCAAAAVTPTSPAAAAPIRSVFMIVSPPLESRI